MTSTSFPHALAFTQQAEGGYSADPNDTGNWYGGALIGSCWGVSAPVLAAWVSPATITAQDMRGLSPTTMSAIYRAQYWQPCNGDGLAAGLDIMVVDHAYNAGVSSALSLYRDVIGQTLTDQTAMLTEARAKVLQTLLGVTRDGIIGKQTLGAIRTQDAQTLVAILALACRQDAFYRGLASFPRYGAGWLNRVSDRTTAALQLYTA